MIVVEAAARGTPSIVVRGPDNAAVELVEDGVNGVIAASARAGGPRGRDRAACTTAVSSCARARAAWFERNAQRLSLERSLERGARELRAPTPRSAPRALGVGHGTHRATEVTPGGALPRELRARSSPAARRRSIAGPPASSARSAPAIAARSSGSKSSAASPATSGSEEAFEHATGTPRAIASSTGRPKPSYSEGNTNAGGDRPQALELGRLEPARPADVVVEAELVRAPRSSLLVCGRVAGEHEHRTALDAMRERLEQRVEVLVRALGREAKQHGAVAEREARAHLGLAQRRRARRRAEPERRRRRCAPAGVPSSSIRSSRVDCESAITRSERRTASGTRMRMPSARTPAWASG